MNDSELKKIRESIDQIDKQLLNLLIERINLVKKIGKYKRENKLEIKDPAREDEILQRLIEEGAKLGLSENLIRKIWVALFNEAYKIETEVPPLW
jgi:chorismate mutase-like protein